MTDIATHLITLQAQAQGPLLAPGYLYARLDGRGFSKLTKAVTRPFDAGLHESMIAAATKALTNFQADIAYIQSDEISLGWSPSHAENASNWIFSGRRDKWLSLLASECSIGLFCDLIQRDSTHYKAFLEQSPHLDCRIVDGLDLKTLIQYFTWRRLDGYRNAVQTLAQHMLPKKSLHQQSIKILKDRLLLTDKPFHTMPDAYKFGTILWWETQTVPIETLDHIPVAHRPPAGTMTTRRVLQRAPFTPTFAHSRFIF
jgi:tRNA(His) 5'-end guanylyltransferase